MDLSASRHTPGSRAHGGLAARLSDLGEAARKGLAVLTPLLDFGIRLFVAGIVQEPWVRWNGHSK